MIFDPPFSHAPDSEEAIVPDLSSALLEELFAAAGEALKARPWKTLHDTDWFGIVDPDTGETHIVAIMGAAGQFYAVQVYLPEEGIRFWNDFIHTGQPDVTLGRFQQRMLSCEFVPWNEEDMDETDMERNDEHDPGLDVDHLDSFLFRSTLPGCVNWHPTEEEARKLLDALRLVPRFLRQWKTRPHKCYQAEFGELLPWIPCYQLPENKDRRQAGQWEFTTVRFPEAGCSETHLPDELFPSRVAAYPARKGEIWQIGSAYFEKAVIVDGRPKWLVLSLVVVEPSGLVLDGDLFPCSEALEVGLRKSFLKAVNEAGHLPETLMVRSPLAQRVFEGIPGLTVIQQDELPSLDQAIRHFRASQDLLSADHPLANLSSEVIERIQTIMADAPPLARMTPEAMAGVVARISEVEGGEAFLQALLEQAGEGEDLFPGIEAIDPIGTESDAAEESPRTPAPKSQGDKPGERFIFRIDLEDIGFPIWRRLSIRSDATFYELHNAIQALFDWDGDHCHCFQKRQGRRIVSSIGPNWEYDDQSEDDTLLKEVFKRKGSKYHYVYDFGDNWSHLIRLEDRVKSRTGDGGPACLAGCGIAPPEDCGGVPGFLNLLDPDSGYADEHDWDPKYLRHLREGKFDPKSVIF